MDGMVDCCSRLTCVGVNFSRYKVKSVTLEEVEVDWGEGEGGMLENR